MLKSNNNTKDENISSYNDIKVSIDNNISFDQFENEVHALCEANLQTSDDINVSEIIKLGEKCLDDLDNLDMNDLLKESNVIVE